MKLLSWSSLLLLPLVGVLIRRRWGGTPNDLSIYDSARWWDDDSSFAILRRMNLVRVPYFLSHFGKDAKNIIDVGCGGGFVAEDIARTGKYSVSGFDISEASLNMAKNHAKSQSLPITYRKGSIYSIPLPDASVDVVIVSDVLEHLDDISGALREIFRVLKPSGVFVFDTIARTAWSYLSTYLVAQELTGIVEPGAHDWGMFINPEELEVSLENAGFTTDRSRWAGIGANLSVVNAIRKNSMYDIIESFFRDDSDFSASYMGYAVKP